MPNFVELAENTVLSEIKDPPPLPPGTYLAMVTGPHEMVESGQKKTPGFQLTLRLLQAREDVDRDALEEYCSATNQSVRDIQLKHTIWESPFAAANLRALLVDTLGIDPALQGKQAFAEVQGKELIVTIANRPFTGNDGKARLRHEISGTARSL